MKPYIIILLILLLSFLTLILYNIIRPRKQLVCMGSNRRLPFQNIQNDKELEEAIQLNSLQRL